MQHTRRGSTWRVPGAAFGDLEMNNKPALILLHLQTGFWPDHNANQVEIQSLIVIRKHDHKQCMICIGVGVA